jgi:transposase-like protein/IS1 family transposase
MNCTSCESTNFKRFGRDRKGNQRYRCLDCGVTFSEPKDKPLGSMYLAEDKAEMCLKLLLEGCSVRSIERITGVHRDTILDLLVTVGAKCERLLEEKIQNVPVKDVQADEIWGFIQMKEKTKKRQDLNDETIGDCYTFIAIDRDTKLILAWHLGRRTVADTFAFTEKLYRATGSHFQLTTDGFNAYPDAIIHSLGTRVDYAQLVKMYAQPQEAERRYSPAECIGAKKIPVIGNPDPERINTSHIERQNLTLRMSTRRLTRLTNAFSKKWPNMKAALALQFAHYNFCRIHSTIRCTPAMEAGLTKTVWTLKDLLRWYP